MNVYMVLSMLFYVLVYMLVYMVTPLPPHVTSQTLLFKIVALWDALYVPLIHRSRFYLAFRGRELFYFEAEHRRLSHLKGQLLPGEEESPFTNKQAKKKLESAQRRLEVFCVGYWVVGWGFSVWWFVGGWEWWVVWDIDVCGRR